MRHVLMPLALAAAVLAPVGCKRPVVIPEAAPKPGTVHTLLRTPADRTPSDGMTKVLGTGWYANVEIDSQGRVHVAWTDADVGDAMYAVLPEDGTGITNASPVEVDGAVGSYLKLALAPGGAPVLSYYNQDRRQLRLAHRPADHARMQAAGVKIADAPSAEKKKKVLVPGEKPPPAPTTGMGPGWHGEDVAFGDNVGMAGDLFVDDKGYAHLTYYTKGERFRYARRPAGEPAFGPGTVGRFTKMDVDPRAGGSYTMSTDLLVQDDGTALVSYCNWNFVDAQVRVGVLAPGAARFQVVEGEPLQRRVDGWHSALVPRDDGAVDVFTVTTGDLKLLRSRFDAKKPAPFAERDEVMGRPGPSVVRRGKDGTVWVLTRGQGFASLGEDPGLWLVRFAGGDFDEATRVVLEEGLGNDPWIDLALRPDGRPVAVWTSRATKSLMMYAP